MRITLIGPRSIGKSTTSKILSEKLNLRYISSDIEIDNKFKEKGGIKAVFNEENKDELFKKAYELFNEVFLQDNFVFDLAGGSLTTKDSNNNLMDFSIVKNNSILIGLLPFKNDSKSINLLKNREKNREHWKNLSDIEILEQTTQHYKKVKNAILENVSNIIYVKNMSTEKIVEKIIKNFEKPKNFKKSVSKKTL